jgi:hypothetical protein
MTSFLLISSVAFGQLETPRPSPLGKIEQTVGVMKVTIEYSRPGVKGRKVFGDLVPYGKVWRTGANAPTTIAFSDNVMVDGNPVPAGTYSLYTIPGETEWTFIVNKKVTGGAQPDEKEDLIRFKAAPKATGKFVETMTFSVGSITNNTAVVELAWENTSVGFGIAFDVDSKVMAQIDEVMKEPFADVAGTYFQAANYYFNNGKDLKKALDWSIRSLDLDPESIFAWRLKANIQAGMKDYNGAIATAKTAIEKAEKANNQEFVKTTQESIAEWEKLK